MYLEIAPGHSSIKKGQHIYMFFFREKNELTLRGEDGWDSN